MSSRRTDKRLVKRSDKHTVAAPTCIHGLIHLLPAQPHEPHRRWKIPLLRNHAHAYNLSEFQGQLSESSMSADGY